MASLQARPSPGFALCNVLFALLFAYSALVQLNDDDWYLWFPFYSVACLVCLTHTLQFTTISRRSAHLGLVFGLLLFVKVMIEVSLSGKVFSWMELISLDMNQRLVREKLGSLLVCLSLWLELEMSGSNLNKGSRQGSLHPGMVLLVLASACLCAAYIIMKE